jgi:site-specific DNA-adenine methylase
MAEEDYTMIPTFKFHGSKCRIAKWIFAHEHIDKIFPINDYYEPFAGRGNSFFYFTSYFKFNNAYLNDLYMCHFLKALRDYSGNYDFVPEYIDKQVFLSLQNHDNEQERSLAESFCAYNGTFWINGANITSSPSKPSKNKHSKQHTIKRMIRAKELLQGVSIDDKDYKQFLDITFHSDDLIYCDPPYIQSSKSKLKDITISHKELANILISLPCKVIVSDYDNPIYDKILHSWNVYEFTRASCGRNSNSTSNVVVEKKWCNF